MRCVAADGELTADFSDSLLVDSQLLSNSLCQLLQIEVARPFPLRSSCLVTLLSVALKGDAVILDLIARKGVTLQSLARRTIFDAVFVRYDHGLDLVVVCVNRIAMVPSITASITGRPARCAANRAVRPAARCGL